MNYNGQGRIHSYSVQDNIQRSLLMTRAANLGRNYSQILRCVASFHVVKVERSPEGGNTVSKTSLEGMSLSDTQIVTSSQEKH
jgi:hypothetical protein